MDLTFTNRITLISRGTSIVLCTHVSDHWTLGYVTNVQTGVVLRHTTQNDGIHDTTTYFFYRTKIPPKTGDYCFSTLMDYYEGDAFQKWLCRVDVGSPYLMLRFWRESGFEINDGNIRTSRNPYFELQVTKPPEEAPKARPKRGKTAWDHILKA